MPNPPTPDELKTQRLDLNLTQEDLAGRMLNLTPDQLATCKLWLIDLRNVRHWENGRRTPDRHNTARVRHALELD